MEDELLELMADTLTYEPPSTYNDRGQVATYGAAVTYRCRIQPANGEVIERAASGEERFAKWRIYIGTVTTLNPEGRLTLPSGFDPRTPPTFAIGRVPDELGSHHQLVLV